MNCRREAQGVVIELLDVEFGRELPLRGGVLMPLWVGDAARIAVDIDYIVASSPLQNATRDRVVAALARPSRPSSCGAVRCVDSEIIKQDTPSPGLRFLAVVESRTGAIEQQVDVAFDDPVAQPPGRMRLAHLGDCGVDAWGYPAESTLAWKIHELFEQPNWRFKHLYDAFAILQRFPIDRAAAAAALRLAFVSRNTPLSRLDRLINGKFGVSRERPKKWRQFRRRHPYLVTPEDHTKLVDVAAAFVRSLRDDLGSEIRSTAY